jgi:hypothetical protein
MVSGERTLTSMHVFPKKKNRNTDKRWQGITEKLFWDSISSGEVRLVD